MLIDGVAGTLLVMRPADQLASNRGPAPYVREPLLSPAPVKAGESLPERVTATLERTIISAFRIRKIPEVACRERPSRRFGADADASSRPESVETGGRDASFMASRRKGGCDTAHVVARPGARFAPPPCLNVRLSAHCAGPPGATCAARLSGQFRRFRRLSGELSGRAQPRTPSSLSQFWSSEYLMTQPWPPSSRTSLYLATNALANAREGSRCRAC